MTVSPSRARAGSFRRQERSGDEHGMQSRKRKGCDLLHETEALVSLIAQHP